MAKKDIVKVRIARGKPDKTVIMPYQIAQLIYDLEQKLKSHLEKGQMKLIARDLATYILALTGCRPCEAAWLAVQPINKVLVKSKQVHTSGYYHDHHYKIDPHIDGRVKVKVKTKTNMTYGFPIPKYANMQLLRDCGMKAMASWKGKGVPKLTIAVCDRFRNRSKS